MKYSREIEHAVITIALCIVFLLVLDVNYYQIIPFIIVAVISNRIPAMDVRLHLGHRNPIMHSFLFPLLISLVAPKNVYITAFFVGYTAHMIGDLDNPKQEWKWIEQRVGIALLWVSFFVLLGLILGVSPLRALKILD